MKEPLSPQSSPGAEPSRRSRWLWRVAAACCVVLLFTLVLPRQRGPRSAIAAGSSALGRGSASAANPADLNRTGSARLPRPRSSSLSGRPAKEIVAGKLVQFAQNRREIAHAMARKFNVAVPDEVEQFFAAAEAGNWDETKRLFDSLLAQSKSNRLRQNGGSENLGDARQASRSTGAPADSLAVLLPTIMETFGVAEEAHTWPPQALLDYGDAVLGSLIPGMVYVGGTDPGRFIPTLLNDTGDDPRHIVLTQNALADPSYIDYLGFLYGDQTAALTQDDRSRALQDYLADVTKRYQHDQQFPDAPRQLRPGENVTMVDGKIDVSGQIAIMGVNELLLQALMQKNPDLSFALEESFPLKSTYAGAVPLGPIMELRATDPQTALTADRAAQSVAYWQQTAQQLLADPETAAVDWTMKTYAKMAAAQGNLFLDHNLNAAGEAALRLACQICPSSPEAVFNYAGLLAKQNRIADAIPVVESAAQAAPDNAQFQSLLQQLKTMPQHR